MEQALPANLEAEQTILGSILYLPELLHLVADRLTPDDFYCASYRHDCIYRAIAYLSEHGEDINSLNVTLRLEHDGITTIRDAPVHRYLSTLWDVALTGGPNIESATEILLNISLTRKLYGFLMQSAQIVKSAERAEVALEQLQQMLYELDAGRTPSDLVPDSQMMSDYLNHLEKQQERQTSSVIGTPTGFDDLDVLLGGMQPQELYILGGRPGTGKTSLMLNVVHHLLFKHPCNIAIFSLEMSRHDLARRLISMESEIDSQRLRFSRKLLDDGEWERIIAATGRLSTDRLYVDESGELSIASMRSKARRHKTKHGLDIIIVDYLQLMQSDTDERNRVVEIGKISRGLKQLAKALDVPVLALAQLSRAVESRADKRPQLSDLRESGSIEADSDVVMFLSVNPQAKHQSILEVAKHRNGPVGDVDLRFIAPLTKFLGVEVPA